MSDGKPFWSSVPGVVTGAAGVISAIVGLLGVSTQLGWIGGDGDKTENVAATSPTTGGAGVPGAAGSAAASTVAVRPGEFEVEPASLTFEPLKPAEATVFVFNSGDVPLTMRAPTFSESGARIFTVTDETCTKSTLAPGRSCEITVRFAAPQIGKYSSKLVVVASNAPRQAEVELTGERSLLG